MDPLPPPLPPEPPPPVEPSPPPPESGGTVAMRAVGGLLAYVVVGAVAMRTQSAILLLPALIAVAIVIAVKGTARGFALGVFIGVGLTLLGVGLCFVALSGMKM